MSSSDISTRLRQQNVTLQLRHVGSGLAVRNVITPVTQSPALVLRGKRAAQAIVQLHKELRLIREGDVQSALYKMKSGSDS